MKKNKGRIIAFIAIILVSFLDAGGSVVSNFFPVVGGILSSISNAAFEFIQVVLTAYIFFFEK